jgi:hypothetical protein
MKPDIPKQIFKTYISDFMKICPVGTELFHVDRQTDKMTLIFAFHNFVNVNVCFLQFQSPEVKLRDSGHHINNSSLENSSSKDKNTSTLYERNACKASTFVNKCLYSHFIIECSADRGMPRHAKRHPAKPPG